MLTYKTFTLDEAKKIFKLKMIGKPVINDGLNPKVDSRKFSLGSMTVLCDTPFAQYLDEIEFKVVIDKNIFRVYQTCEFPVKMTDDEAKKQLGVNSEQYKRWKNQLVLYCGKPKKQDE
jgi:hypothetical protein